MKKLYILKLALCALLAVCCLACNGNSAANQSNTKEQKKASKNEGFLIYDGIEMPQIYVDKDEHISIKRAAQDLQRDIEALTGKKPQIVNQSGELGAKAILIGSLQNEQMQKILAQNQVQQNSLEGKYEAYAIRPTKSGEGLIILGSDNLGTVYGIYDLCEKLGVDPLYWWGDIPIERKEKLSLKNPKIDGEQPSVRYRGIFINDEEALIKWSGNTSKDKTKGAISPESYKRIFELMLRLKANTVWPSMMEAGSYFFEFKDEKGEAINPRNATDFGIYIGTSHCENMARNNYAEWYEWAEENKHLFDMKRNTRGEYEFDYTVNPEAIEIYWRQRLEESKNFNMIYTMGIRGVHDSPFMCRMLENPTLERRVALLQKVINLQRQMIKEVFGREDAVPQIFVPYEETAELYNGESKDFKEKCEGLKLPEDIIVVSTEDNYGNIRQLPKPTEVERKGGCGIYYHLAYQGYPSPYDWLTSMPYPLMQQELKKVYEAGSRTFWIVNVGDIKPAEMGLQLFMKMADKAPKYLYTPTEEYIKAEYADIFDFDDKQTQEVSEIVEHFQSLANSNKPEFMSSFWSVYFETTRYVFSFFSPFDFGDEAQQKIEEWKGLEQRAKSIYDGLSEDLKPAFWHFVYYPIRASRQMCEKSYYYHKNVLYAKQGRFASVNAYKRLSEQAAKEIRADLDYYNEEFQGGKWRGITDPYGDYNITERVFDIAGIPEKFIYEERFIEQAQNGIGAVCEGQATGKEDVELRFSAYEGNRRFVDVFARGLDAQAWSIESSADWIKPSKAKGSTQTEERIWLSIDWAKAAAGKNLGKITLKGEDGFEKAFRVVAQNNMFDLRAKTYAEGCGFVAIEAEDYSSSRPGKMGESWVRKDKLGYCGASMTLERKSTEAIRNAAQGAAKGASIKCQNPKADGAALTYNIYFDNAGEFSGLLFRLPTLNEGKGKSCSLAVGIDAQEPQVLSGVRAKNSRHTSTLANGKKETRSWHTNVAAQMEKIPFVFKIDKPGYHTLTVYGVDEHICIDRIVIATDEQALMALNRSIIGPTQSYNNISPSYEKPKPKQTILIDEALAATRAYPQPEPLIYAKFAFSRYGNPEVWGFKTVSDKTIFDKNVNQYGWRAEDIENVTCGHNESTRIVPHWRRDNNRGRKPTTFCVSLLEGDYEMTIHSGLIRYYGYGGAAYDIKMNLKANDQVLMTSELFKLDAPSSRTYNIKVGRDNLLELEFSGIWSVSAIEFYRK